MRCCHSKRRGSPLESVSTESVSGDASVMVR